MASGGPPEEDKNGQDWVDEDGHFKCKQCELEGVFRTENELRFLRYHLTAFHGWQNPYKCTINGCNEILREKSYLRAHIEESHPHRRRNLNRGFNPEPSGSRNPNQGFSADPSASRNLSRALSPECIEISDNSNESFPSGPSASNLNQGFNPEPSGSRNLNQGFSPEPSGSRNRPFKKRFSGSPKKNKFTSSPKRRFSESPKKRSFSNSPTKSFSGSPTKKSLAPLKKGIR